MRHSSRALTGCSCLILVPCHKALLLKWESLLQSSVLHRPLVLGQRVSEARIEYCVASEDCAFGPIGFQRVRDIAPGEMLVQSTCFLLASKGARYQAKKFVCTDTQ